MKRRLGIFLMALGVLLLVGAGYSFLSNGAEEEAGGNAAQQVMEDMQQALFGAPPLTAAPSPAPFAREMPEIMIDGQAYIGYLELPTIDLKLPVMSEWSYPKLKTAPCRYWGNAYDDSMVILAHNYGRHFGKISTLEIGDPVQFIDAEGNILRYEVAGHEVLESTDVRKMITDQWDLTLFTCTYGGLKRATVRLQRVLAFAE